jgi:predicted membrane protein
MGGSHRRGRYRLNSAVNVIAVMGGDEIDLRDAELDGGQVTLTVISIMGGVSIYVPDTIEACTRKGSLATCTALRPSPGSTCSPAGHRRRGVG